MRGNPLGKFMPKMQLTAHRLCPLVLLLTAGLAPSSTLAESFFWCPSPDGVSYYVHPMSSSAEEALKTAQANWDFKFLAKPQHCQSEAEFDVAYQAAFARSPQWQEAIKPIKQDTKPFEQGCGQLLSQGEPYPLSIARVLDAPQGCNRVLSIEQQLFIAGVSQQLKEQCQSDVDGRTMKFMALAEAGALGGTRPIRQGQGPDATVSDTVDAIQAARAPLLAGHAYAKRLGAQACATDKRWFAGLQRYLDDTSQPSSAPFIASCVAYYRNTVTPDKCQCVGDVLRISNPWIFSRPYDAEDLREATKLSVLGASLLTCGIYRFDRPAAPVSAPSPSIAKRRECVKFGEQGEGSKVPEERAALIERCMAADDADSSPTEMPDSNTPVYRSRIFDLNGQSGSTLMVGVPYPDESGPALTAGGSNLFNLLFRNPSNQKFLLCDYRKEPKPGVGVSTASYPFWYQHAPPDIEQWLTIDTRNSLRYIGTRAFTECPATLAEADAQRQLAVEHADSPALAQMRARYSRAK